MAKGREKSNVKVPFFHKLSVQMVIILAVMLILFVTQCFLGIRAVKRTQRVATHMMEVTNEEISQRNYIKICYEKQRRYVGTYILAEDSEAKEKALKDIEKKKKQIPEKTQELKDYIEMYRIGEEADIGIDEMLAATEVYNELIDNVLGQLKEDNTQEIFSLFYAQAEEIDDQFDAGMDKLDQYIEESKEEATGFIGNTVSATLQATIIMTVVFLIMFAGAYYVINHNMLRVISLAVRDMQGVIDTIKADKGDLTYRVPVRSKNEISILVGAFNEFMQTLQGILQKLKMCSDHIKKTSDDMYSEVTRANDSVTNSSAALEQLSAKMISVTDIVETMNQNLADVTTSVEGIRGKANEGTMMAQKIMEDANYVKRRVEERKNNTGERMENMSQVLNASVKNSEKVSRINELTGVILDIASQTNLLALNASIEAARVGEEGKGFTVVAEEIGALAQNSRDTANNIQQISKEVTDAVRALADNAMEIMEFINTAVIDDYDAFVRTGDKYGESAVKFNTILMNFYDQSNTLNDIMTQMSGSISLITQSVNESTSAIEMSAENSTEIVKEIQLIQESLDVNQKVAEELESEVGKFEKC